MREELERLKIESDALNRKCSELETELASVKAERDSLVETALTPEKRERILDALGVGKQSLQYKRVKAVLDQFVNEVKRDG